MLGNGQSDYITTQTPSSCGEPSVSSPSNCEALLSYMILEFESLDTLVNLVLVSWWQCMLQGIDYYLVRLHDLRRVHSTVLWVGAWTHLMKLYVAPSYSPPGFLSFEMECLVTLNSIPRDCVMKRFVLQTKAGDHKQLFWEINDAVYCAWKSRQWFVEFQAHEWAAIYTCGIISEQDSGSSIILGYQKPQGSGGLSYDIFQLCSAWNGDV